jgi:hypothetical protein
LTRFPGRRAVAAALLACLGAASMADELKESIEYVSRLSDACSYADGYVCRPVSEDDFLRREPGRLLLPGPYLQAWEACYRDFLSAPDLSQEQKKLKHYEIGFTENDREIVVLFRALLLPRLENGKPGGVMRATLGRSVKYRLDRRTLEIRERLMPKS